MSVQNFKVSDGFQLFSRKWLPKDRAPSNCVICLHGTGENSDFFEPIGMDLSERGYAVVALDLRGFGRSVERGLERGDTSSFKRQLTDLLEVVDSTRARYMPKRVALLGHSNGCAFALWLAAQLPENIGGLILAAPPVLVASDSRVPRRQYLKFVLALLLRPKTKYAFGSETQKDSSTLVRGDSPITKSVSIRWLYGQKKHLIDPMFSYAKQIQIPTLVINGKEDRVSLPIGTEKLFQALGAKDKTIHIFDQADHFLHSEFLPLAGERDPRGRIVAHTITDWLSTRLICC